jgi:hypothetical protein
MPRSVPSVNTVRGALYFAFGILHFLSIPHLTLTKQTFGFLDRKG